MSSEFRRKRRRGTRLQSLSRLLRGVSPPFVVLMFVHFASA